MTKIRFIDRISQLEESENVYGEVFLKTFYSANVFSKTIALMLKRFLSSAAFSAMYGAVQKSPFSRVKIKPFIKKYLVDTSEFLDPVDSFKSFNDFFIRKLKPESRPIARGSNVAVLPADGRYLVYPNIEKADGFLVKGKKFSLKTLLEDEALAAKYAEGSMVIARLCPVDYHRYHFPCDCIAGHPKEINGPLFSVSPIALKRNIAILSENKRVLTQLQTKNFGTVLFIEVGATCVGTILHNFIPDRHYAKGDEKGYFSFGGSCIILLFEPNTIQFDQDLIDASQKKTETRALFGQSLGRSML